MDLSQITDLVTLKSMAYDAIFNKEQAERELQNINNRISQIVQEQFQEVTTPNELAPIEVSAEPNGSDNETTANGAEDSTTTETTTETTTVAP